MSYISQKDLDHLLSNRDLHAAVTRIRLEIRNKALLYAEYFYFSRNQISGERGVAISQNEWRTTVREIEFTLLADAPPVYTRLEVEKWNPLGLFFEEINPNHRIVSILQIDPITGAVVVFTNPTQGRESE